MASKKIYLATIIYQNITVPPVSTYITKARNTISSITLIIVTLIGTTRVIRYSISQAIATYSTIIRSVTSIVKILIASNVNI